MKKGIGYKYLLILLATGIIVLLSFTFGVFAQQLTAEVVGYKIVVDKEEKKIDNDIVTINDRTYVPLRAVAEMLGKQVAWDEETQTVTIDSYAPIMDDDLTPEEIKVEEEQLEFIKDGLWGVMDKEGNIILPPISYSQTWFSEGLAPIKNKEGKFGYVDMKGKLIIPYLFSDAKPFQEGMAPVQKEELYGYINKKGEFVVPPKFYYADTFQGGLAKVGTRMLEIGEDKYGISCDYPCAFNYIDKMGRLVLKEEFAHINSFSPAFAYGITMNGEDVYFDKEGNYLEGGEYLEPWIEFSVPRDVSMPKVSENRENGTVSVLDENGKAIKTVQGHKYFYKDGYVFIFTDENETDSFYIDTKGEIIAPK